MSVKNFIHCWISRILSQIISGNTDLPLLTDSDIKLLKKIPFCNRFEKNYLIYTLFGQRNNLQFIKFFIKLKWSNVE